MQDGCEYCLLKVFTKCLGKAIGLGAFHRDEEGGKGAQRRLIYSFYLRGEQAWRDGTHVRAAPDGYTPLAIDKTCSTADDP